MEQIPLQLICQSTSQVPEIAWRSEKVIFVTMWASVVVVPIDTGYWGSQLGQCKQQEDRSQIS
jgi:hypothetical protein